MNLNPNLQKLQEEKQEEICAVCPWTLEDHLPTSMCEGCSCTEALQEYLEQNDLDENGEPSKD